MVWQFGEAEGLEATLCRPHVEDGLGTSAHRGGAEVKHDLHRDLFLQRFRQVQEPTGDGKLVQPGLHLAAIFHPEQGQNRAGQLDPRGARSGVQFGGKGHSDTTMPRSNLRWQITKEPVI